MVASRVDPLHSDAEESNLFEQMRLPVSSKKLNEDVELLPSCTYVDEPERERSPDSPHASASSGCGAFAGASFASVVEAPSRRRAPSWHSDVTDFDDLTSPGAQAEHSEEYQKALYGHMFDLQQAVYWNGMIASCPLASTSWTGDTASLNQFMLPYGSTVGDLESQADELSRAADMLLNAANQAQVQAQQMRNVHGNDDGAQMPSGLSPRSTPTSSEVQRPRWSDMAPEPAFEPQCSPSESSRTSVMLRNLPNDYTREMLLDLLDSHGFHGQYNFLYVPIDFTRKAGLGYAFVNMATSQAAERIFEVMQGFTSWHYSSTKVLEIAWGNPLQGLEAHIDRYRNSPVMHKDVPEKFKPLLFEGGVRLPFPPPTKRLQRPRLKGRHTSTSQ